MNLVIVESPAKAKTIEKYLGKGYKVMASKGHVVDLPKSGLGVDVENKFKVEYVVTKEAVVRELKRAAKDATEIIIAADPDREGEAIGWHIAQELKVLGKPKLKRIVFTEITKDAVQNAVQNPRGIDMDLVDAQQARRVLDRLVGYKLSPLLWKKIRYGLSAGRVQSVALRLIVEREIEREKFDPKEYWTLQAKLSPNSGTKVSVEIKLKSENAEEEGIKDDSDEDEDSTWFNLQSKSDGSKVEPAKQSEIDKIVDSLSDAKWIITSREEKQVTKNTYPPFNTSSLQQAGANRLHMSASRTMKVAQQLYEAGHITYMRTDSIHFANEAVAAARRFIENEYGQSYLPEKPIFYKSRSKVAQEAHEAIRPTNWAKNAVSLGLDSDLAKLYELIRSRGLASQMNPAKFTQISYKAEAASYVFTASFRRMDFPGYMKVLPERRSEVVIPEFKENQQVYPAELIGLQHFTQPPPRYSEASLIKELESLGIGRPSTYAPTIQTLLTRKYVDKTGAYFIPTDTGRVVTALLVENFEDIMDVKFTADLEDKLDDIANGKQDWIEMMDKFYRPFEKSLEKKEKGISRQDFTVLGPSDVPCPECGKKMVIKLGKNGRFLSCADFPECKGMADISGETEEDTQAKVKTAEFQEQYLPAPKTDDGRDYLLRKGRFGEFWAHPDYPKVKDARPLELTPTKQKEMYGDAPRTDDGREFLLKSGKFGKFWAHPDYPKVKEIISVKKAKGEEGSSAPRSGFTKFKSRAKSKTKKTKK